MTLPTLTSFDFSAGTALGTRFYGAYTNLARWSDDLSNAAWTKNDVSITANAAVAPDGTMTMDKIVENSSAAAHQVVTVASVISGQQYTSSIFVAGAERTKLRIDGNDGAVGAGNYVEFDLATKTMAAAGNCVGKIEELTSGIFRCSVMFTAVATTSASFSVILRDAAGLAFYTGDGTSGLYAWGQMITATAFPVPYVPTTSATVTRNTDGALFLSGTDVTDFYNPREGSVFVEFTPRANVSFPGVIDFFQDSNNRIGYLLNGSTMTGILSIKSGGVTQASLNPAVSTLNISERVAFATNIALLSRNGATVLSDTSVTVPTAIVGLRIGLFDTELNGHIKRAIYWPKAFDATTLQRMTA